MGTNFETFKLIHEEEVAIKERNTLLSYKEKLIKTFIVIIEVMDETLPLHLMY